MVRFLTAAVISSVCAFGAGVGQAAVLLTDSVVFSANSEGNNWNGWSWNTQGRPADVPDRWNMYYSTSPDAANPTFINSRNDENAEISIPMTPGTFNFLIFGESVTTAIDPQQHFVLNLYFNGDQSAPLISGLSGPSCVGVCPAGHPNGLDLFGNAPQQGANALSFEQDGLEVALSAFDWRIGDNVDAVWSTWANDAPYANGSGVPDFVGRLQLTVTQTSVVAPVPLPASLPLLAAAFGLATLAARRARRA